MTVDTAPLYHQTTNQDIALQPCLVSPSPKCSSWDDAPWTAIKVSNGYLDCGITLGIFESSHWSGGSALGLIGGSEPRIRRWASQVRHVSVPRLALRMWYQFGARYPANPSLEGVLAMHIGWDAVSSKCVIFGAVFRRIAGLRTTRGVHAAHRILWMKSMQQDSETR